MELKRYERAVKLAVASLALLTALTCTSQAQVTLSQVLNGLVVRGAGSVTLTWDSLGSMFGTNTYSVQRKLNFNDPAWTPLTNALPSGGETTTFADTAVGASSNAFYRISWP
jgi:hypothetical protein